MKHKLNGFKRIKNGIWSTRGEWQPVYAINQQKQSGNEYQHYIYGPDNKPLCAGVTRHEHMNRAVANQIVHVWNRWRNEYIARNPGNYPTAQQVSIPVAKIAVFPIGDNSKVEWFTFV